MRLLTIRILIPLICILTLSGCYTNRTRINLNADGSGTLVVTYTATQRLLTMAKSQFNQTIEQKFFQAEQLKGAAAAYGKDVEYVRHNVFDIEDGKAFIATYSFPDIHELRIGAAQQAQALGQQRAVQKHFGFTLKDNFLQIEIPELNPPAAKEARVRVESPEASQQRQARFRKNRDSLMRNGNPLNLKGDEDEAGLTLKLLEGMRFQVELNLPGSIQATTASYTKSGEQGDLITLLDIPLDEMLKDADFLKRVSSDEQASLGLADVANLPGVRLETNSPVRVYFGTEN